MSTEIDRYNPTFSLFPIQNDRTAWKPVWLPVILVVPYKRIEGADVPNAGVFDVTYFIEEAPGPSPVAGFKNQGIFVPDYERFAVNIDTASLSLYRLDLRGNVFIDQDTGAEKDFADARDGDLVYITVTNGGATDTITYYSDADYYDLSTISIGTVELKPLGSYNFVWQAAYKERVITPDNEVLCISDIDKLTRLAVLFKHPGDVHQSMVENTPSVYFDGTSRDQDKTVEFYRPFADVLQDIFDEQTFIRGINWVSRIPVQYIPYLGFLIGWDPPYFSSIDDNVRLSFIRNARKLQKLKGSKRAIVELFEIFGFTIDIVNLWYRSDGNAFIGPFDEPEEGFENDYVTEVEVCATEPLIADNNESGFGNVTVPLLYRPTGNVTVEAWLVDDGTSRDELNALVNQSILDPDSLEQEMCSVTPDGMLISDALQGVSTATLVGQTKVLVDIDTGLGTEELDVGEGPLNKEGVTYNRDQNTLTIIYDRYLDLSNQRLFVFAIYDREKITPSPSLQDLRSNRFDIRVLLFKDGEQPDSDLYDFLLDFLFKIKAFHSLLRKVTFEVEELDVYNVIDFCMGGRTKQAPGTSAGELQVPPAVIPTDITCTDDGQSRGFKEDDLSLREKIIGGLEDEHRTWKDLDGTHEIPGSLRPIIESLSRVTIPDPESSPCEWNYRGQNRVVADPDLDPDQQPDDRERLCSLEGNTKDYCYKGRAKDELNVQSTVSLTDSARCNPCTLMMGEGLYWTKRIFESLERWQSQSNIRASWSDRQFVQRAAWNDPLHYTNRSLIGPENQDGLLAIRRPSLDIMKDSMHFPGHRFIQQFALLDTFLSPDYYFRPWDALLNLPCPEDTPLIDGHPVPIPDLNPHLVTDTNGDEWLVYDKVQLVYYGNGLPQDVVSYGDHAPGTESEVEAKDVTHAIYTTAQSLVGTGEDPITFDTLTPTDEGIICTDDPIFQSANRECVCATDSIEDYVDGYPSETGTFPYDDTLGFIGDDAGRIIWATLLGLPLAGSDEPPDLLFKAGSGIRSSEAIYEPYRYDCGCVLIDCATNVTNMQEFVERCNVPYYIDQAGDLDFDCDKVDIIRSMILEETISTCSFVFNGEIPSYFQLDDTKVIWDTSGPIPVGSYKFIDEWGTIHTGQFRTSGDTLDITWTSMQPRVWGEPETGFTDGRRVYKKGIITTCRQILRIVNGEIFVTAEGCEQTVGFFQTNLACGDQRYLDPFLYHFDCAITDQVEFEIICGPKWADPAEGSAAPSFWPGLAFDTGGTEGQVIIDPTVGHEFFWIDAWGNEEEIISDCPEDEAQCNGWGYEWGYCWGY